MKQRLLNKLAVPVFAGVCFVCIPGFTVAQNCIPTNINGSVINVVCPRTCTDLVFPIPHIKGSSDYSVTSIPYNPYPFVTASGVELIDLYADDVYSSVINLPFTFCFFGTTYNSCVIGSNGILTFDVSNANTINGWSLTTVPNGSVPQPIPYNGGVPNTTASTFYPPASIMGAYHDIYPLLPAGGQRRIEYSIVGNAPCRKFIVSYYRVPLYGSAACNNRLCTEQFVLHESTGIIDFFFEDKPVCNTWNQGLAILGIQNWNRDQAVAAPGKNCTVWSESNTGYRFTPSGPGSRFVSSQLFTLSGTLVATADTSTVTPGLLNLGFLNICPPLGSTQYEVRTTFSSCSDPGVFLVSTDTITLNRNNSLNATATTTNNGCGPPSGTITVTVPAGAGIAPYTYVLDGGAPISAGNTYTFTGLLHGPHTVVVTDAGGICSSTINVTVNRSNALTANITTTPTFCSGSASGTITATPTNGSGPYTFTLNGGAPVTGASSYTFTGLSAGTHTLVIADATGCMSNTINITITDGPGVLATASSTATSCPTASNGSITVNTTSGVRPFIYRLDGGAGQSGPNTYTFNNVTAGSHTVNITDSAGCSFTLTVNVAPGPVLAANNTPVATTCNGAMDGRIIVTPLNGVSPYTFSLDAMPPVAGAAPYTFTNLHSNLPNIQIFDAAGCASIVYTVTVPAGPDLTSTATKTDVLCNGDTNGTITVNQPASGSPPFQYSLDGVNWQASRTFTGLAPGNYTVFFRSANGCQGSLTITIGEPPVLTASVSSTPVTCNGQNNGIISVTTAGGVPPYQYSVDGGLNWQAGSTFNVRAGNYSISIRDANNCLTTRNIIVTEPPLLTARSDDTNATCDGGNDGTITVTATGGSSGYQYAINGGTFQASNIFNVGPGNYIVTVRDNLGCLSSFNTKVGLTSNLFLNPSADLTICEGGSTRLQPVSNATIYTWTPSAGLSNPNIANPVASPITSTQYMLTATLGRCSLQDTILLNVNSAPVPDAGPDGTICYGQSFTLQGSGGTQYTWSPALYLNTTSGANPVSTPTVSTVYSLSVMDNNGCRSLVPDEVQVIVNRSMRVRTFPFDTVAVPGDQFRLLAVSPGISYNWSPATGLSDPTIPDPVVTVSGTIGDEISYRVASVDSMGCNAEGFVHIKVYNGPAIYVPTGFTPNGDGNNDKFTPFPVGIRSYNYFRIFNRWGQLVFSTTRLHEGWDGKIDGKEQPTGLYVWVIQGITMNNQVISKKGTVALIR